MPKNGSVVQQNVIVDGLNLAYRTYHAMKLIPEPLVDGNGKPTGLLFGFLRSLAALNSRFEAHQFHVVWDGSRQRRSSRYPEYKATRGKVDIYSDGQLNDIQTILPLLGVAQAHNPNEEADDVVASLVRGRLKGNHNLIVSTDHDFLQLVTYTDHLFIPKVGNRSEILYDPDRVMAEYGVPSDRIVHLRALLGDTSDNLPGVPKVPAKTLTSLLRVHQTIDGIFSSSMVGITADQYAKLRASEGQVRLNLDLMALQDVPYTIIEPAVNFDGASKMLSERSVRPDQIVTSFANAAPLGFTKVSEQQYATSLN